MGTSLMRAMLLTTASVAMVATVAPTAAYAQDATYQIDIPTQSMGDALRALGKATRQNIVFDGSMVKGKRSAAVRGRMTASEALTQMLAGSGLTTGRGTGGGLTVVKEGNATSTSSVSSANGDDAIAIVVTGTSLRNVRPAGSPITQIDREAIDNTGLTSTQDVIRALPQNFGGGASETTTGTLRDNANLNFASGTGINLRGLGNDSTLVLVNGNRVAPSGLGGSFVDVSMIPLSAVKRIDVLTDSASAIYGSDAIGGVVNIILNDDFSGFETEIGAGVTTQGGRGSMRAAQSAGVEWGSGHATFSYSYSWQDHLDVSQRKFSADALGPTDLTPKQERQSVFATISQNIGGGGTRIFAQGLASKSNSDQVYNNARFPAGLQQNDIDAKSEQLSSSLGITVPLSNEISFDANGNYSRTTTKGNSFRAGAPLGPTNSATRIAGITAKIGGGIVELPAGTLRSVVGVEFRKESLFSSTGGSQLLSPPHLRRDIRAAYGEVFVPITSPDQNMMFFNELTFSAAARYEHYSDFNNAFSPRVGIDWSPIEGLQFRGSWGRSFRAPLLSELDTTFKQAIIFDLPNPSSPSGVTPTLISIGAPVPNLGPERAEIWSAGVDVVPTAIPRLRLSATYYNINFTDRIGAPSLGLFDAFLDANAAPFVTLNPSQEYLEEVASALGFPLLNLSDLISQPGDAGAVYELRTRNLAQTRAEGIDFSANYQTELGKVELAFSANAGYILSNKEKLSSTSSFVERAGTIFYPADFKMRMGLTANYDGTSFSAFGNYVGPYQDNQSVGEFRRVSSWTTFDVNVAYTFASDARALDGLRISLSVQNILDKDPPLVTDQDGSSLSSFGFDQTNANPFGRVVNLTLRKTW